MGTDCIFVYRWSRPQLVCFYNYLGTFVRVTFLRHDGSVGIVGIKACLGRKVEQGLYFLKILEVVVLLEFVAFGSLVSGVLYAQHRLINRNSTKHYIDKIFYNTGIAIIDRDKDVQQRKSSFPH
jgi:hypothetical protein